jgi:hypothetical protein
MAQAIHIGDTITVSFVGVGPDGDDVERPLTVTGLVVFVDEDGSTIAIGDPTIDGPQDFVEVCLDDPRTTIDRLTRATRSSSVDTTAFA